MNPFISADLLIPQNANMSQWAVIACDQFTSQPEYWDEVRSFVGDEPSALSMIVPEAYLPQTNEETIGRIHASMKEAKLNNFFKALPQSYVYVERTLQSGEIRRGVVGVIDLEAYDYHPDAKSQIRATEKTVEERIPPRMAVRENALLELSHVLLLCNDETQTVIESLTAEKESLEKLYEFDLMQNGGHIAGWLIEGKSRNAFETRLLCYCTQMAKQQNTDIQNALLYAVGDGNHSLATAKACYEKLKSEHPDEDLSNHPSRYAMVELNNIYDKTLVFEPIHRVISGTDPEELLKAFRSACPSGETTIEIVYGKTCTQVSIDCAGRLPIAVVQDFLDDYLASHPGKIDYIHDTPAVKQLAEKAGSIGILLPAMEKESLFPGIVRGGVLPRKTFSMGHASEKRYYLEARWIQ